MNPIKPPKQCSHCQTVNQLGGEGNGTPLQYSGLENLMDRRAWWAAAHGVTKSRTRLSDFTFTFHFHALEKEMATHSSVLAWRIPGAVKPGGLPSMGSHRVRHDWSDLAAAAAAAANWLEWKISFIYVFNNLFRSIWKKFLQYKKYLLNWYIWSFYFT